jgi:glycine betaine/proline transport system ATP-binding protein
MDQRKHRGGTKPMKPIVVQTRNLSKLYGKQKKEAYKLLKKNVTKDEILKKTGVTVALHDVNLDIYEGEIFVIIGLSGSGKSTLVRCFNRLNVPSKGELRYKDVVIQTLRGKDLLDFRREKIAMVFQSFGLMSHRTVLGNVEYGLEIKGVSKDERRNKALEMIEMVGLSGFEDKPISALSGGMKQRVGLARALANDPEVLLMDEPFSALDPLVKKSMQFELLNIQQKMKKTIIFITHDINEAFKLGDRVAIMRDGMVVQVDTPENMLVNPKDDYVKNFVQGADRSQVMQVKHIMITPSCLIWTEDGPHRAIQEMRSNNVSSAYVVNHDMVFKGVVSLDEAFKLKSQRVDRFNDFEESTPHLDPDMPLIDAMQIAKESRYPLPVIKQEKLIGIVSKASLLSALSD